MAGTRGRPAKRSASLHIIRDMILLALDATENPAMTERNRIEARAALAEALDAMEGRA